MPSINSIGSLESNTYTIDKYCGISFVIVVCLALKEVYTSIIVFFVYRFIIRIVYNPLLGRSFPNILCISITTFFIIYLYKEARHFPTTYYT